MQNYQESKIYFISTQQAECKSCRNPLCTKETSQAIRELKLPIQQKHVRHCIREASFPCETDREVKGICLPFYTFAWTATVAFWRRERQPCGWTCVAYAR